MIVLNGKIDIVIEMRKKNWIARAWGITFGQWFFGLVVFSRRKDLDAAPAAKE
jgi:type IV secretory pathway TrbD component